MGHLGGRKPGDVGRGTREVNVNIREVDPAARSGCNQGSFLAVCLTSHAVDEDPHPAFGHALYGHDKISVRFSWPARPVQGRWAGRCGRPGRRSAAGTHSTAALARTSTHSTT